MYLVRPMRGTASELGLKQLFRLLSNTLGRQNKPSWAKIGDRATIGLVGYRLKSQTDTRTKRLHRNFKLNLKLKPQLRSPNDCLHITEEYKSRSQQDVKETSVADNNLRRGQSLRSC